jgi:hypothetical protein
MEYAVRTTNASLATSIPVNMNTLLTNMSSVKSSSSLFGPSSWTRHGLPKLVGALAFRTDVSPHSTVPLGNTANASLATGVRVTALARPRVVERSREVARPPRAAAPVVRGGRKDAARPAGVTLDPV